jgi:hypothetical protein
MNETHTEGVPLLDERGEPMLDAEGLPMMEEEEEEKEEVCF